MDEVRVPLLSIGDYEEAKQILEWAVIQRPEVSWSLVEVGPYGVHGKRLQPDKNLTHQP